MSSYQVNAADDFFGHLFGIKKVVLKLKKKLRKTKRAKRRAQQQAKEAELELQECEDQLADGGNGDIRNRGDIVNLPEDLQDRLAELAERPNRYPPLVAFSEADDPSQLFQYHLDEAVEASVSRDADDR